MKLKKLDVLNKPYKIYAEVLDSGSIEQFVNVMSHPAIVQGALMPDAHSGYVLPIGGVVASKDLIFPAFVGYDIGCGMCAVPTTFDLAEIKIFAKEIFYEIYRQIPVGFNHYKTPQDWKEFNSIPKTDFLKNVVKNGGMNQLGTLGSGNHFIEIGTDADNCVWIIIHSGSRNVGHKIATHYMTIAADEALARDGKSPQGKAKEGVFGLDCNSQTGKDYIIDMNFALAFALENRRQMIQSVVKCIQKFTDGKESIDLFINRNHNHAELKDDLWIHRKGATHAEYGMMGVIPGNMRDGSFIVTGMGNPESLYSSSHGAGRVMGRAEAKRQLSFDDFSDTMLGIVAKVDDSTLDEAPMAYKDIFEVMRLQGDLVQIVYHVKPIINIKG